MDNLLNKNALEIIDSGIQARYCYKQGYECLKEHDRENAKMFLSKGDEYLLDASLKHHSLLKINSELNLLVVHAEDILNTTHLYLSMISELICLINKEILP